MIDKLCIDLASHHHEFLDKTMPEALDLAAALWSERLALKFIEGVANEYTWSELRTAVDHVRSGLEAAGVRPGDKVGLLLGNQLEFPLSWLGVIEAGAIAVPMNPKYTAPEVEFVATDAEATWLVAGTEQIARLATDHGIGAIPFDHIVAVGEDTNRGEVAFSELLEADITPRTHSAGSGDVVNIQFTSGTTGLPKGCLLTHAYWMQMGVYSSALFDDPQRLLADHPFYYMQNQGYFTMAIAGGGALYITNGLSRRKFMGWLRDNQIDFAWIDEAMLDEPEVPADKAMAMKKAPIAGIFGETHVALEKRFNLQARDWYASTEIGSGTFVPWERTDLVGVPTMGLAWPTRETKVIDGDGNELGAGESGELCVRGPGMMLGYHNRPEVNAELFLPGGWFRTGDVVRKDADGLHYFEGRIKDMIKRSGENISCAEVELRILALPDVEEVGVVPVPDRNRGEEVKAIVVRKDDSTVTAQDIEAWCREGLTAYKVPRYIEFRDSLPHTASGKVAKAELRAEPVPLADEVVDLRPTPAPTAE